MTPAEAEAEIACLRALLRPFADAADNWRGHREDVAILGRSGLRVRHFRLAADFLNPPAEPPAQQELI